MWSLQLLAAPGDGVAPAVLVTVGDERRGGQYLINAPEGYARLALEHHARPTGRLRAALVTTLASRGVSGLAGLIMRLRSDGHGEVRVVGPPGVASVAGALRHLVAWRHPTVFVDEACRDDERVYEDDLVEVRGAWVVEGRWRGFQPPSPPSAADDDAPRATYDLFDPAWCTPLYVCPPVADPVTPSSSPLWAFVVWIKATKTAVAFVDCADAPTAAAATSHPLSAWLAAPSSPVATVVHLTPPTVAGTPTYAAWAASLAGVAVLASVPPGPPARAVGHLSSARLLARLARRVDGGLFPVPGAQGVAGAATPLPPGVVPGRLLLRVRGPGGDGQAAVVDDAECVPEWDPEAVSDDNDDDENDVTPPPIKRPRPLVPPPPPTTNSGAAAALRARLTGGNSTSKDQTLPAPSTTTTPILTFLGTGSAEPSPHRGASGVHVALPSGRGVLLDAGEGSVGALHRALGADAGAIAVRALALLWLSHHHADHVLGAVGVLEARGREREEAGAPPVPPLLVVAPAGVVKWLRAAAAAAGVGDRATYVTAASMYGPSGAAARASVSAALGADTTLTLVPAAHCADAHSAVLRAPGWSLAHSGDTAPTPALAAAAAGVGALIHEATFADCEAAHAARKRHATTGGALRVAVAARAGVALLTHFSQRYPGLPPDAADDPAAWAAARAAATFDGMRVWLGDGGRAVEATVRAAAVLGRRREEEGEGGGRGKRRAREDEKKGRPLTLPSVPNYADRYFVSLSLSLDEWKNGKKDRF